MIIKDKKNLNSIVDIYIFTILILMILIYKSFNELREIFSYGILKKETLTEKSNIGFDMKIKMK